jgi:hypothetical protein
MKDCHQDQWMKHHKWIIAIALIALGYYLFTEHREHIQAILPYLFLAACPLMHFFMHGKHHHKE